VDTLSVFQIRNKSQSDLWEQQKYSVAFVWVILPELSKTMGDIHQQS